MALALYRKYRPGSFAEVVGQEHVTGPLQQAIRNGRVHHAYLFSGPRGCGKTTSARVLARSLNCAAGPTPEPCGSCDSCVALAPNGPGSIDVIEIDAASHGGVDDARELRERAFFAPVSSRFKIYVIDEAHMVSKDGFNALLKLVEEPPEHIKLIFCTTEPEKVIGTIRSRTHHYPFRLMAPQVLRALLAKMCEDEGINVEPAVLPLVVRAGAGSARDGLSVLDQLLAGAGAEGVSYKQAVALLGYTDENLLDQVIDAMTASDGATVFETVDQVISSGHDPRRFAADLLQRLRDLVVLAAVPDVEHKGLIDAPPDQLERMRGQADRGGAAALTRAADIVSVALTEMRGATAPRLLLELMCARLLLPEAVGGEAALAARLDRMERRLRLAGAGAPDTAATQPPPTPPDAGSGGGLAAGAGSSAGSGRGSAADGGSPDAGAGLSAAPAGSGGGLSAGSGSSAASGGSPVVGSGGGSAAGAGSSAAPGGGRPAPGSGSPPADAAGSAAASGGSPAAGSGGGSAAGSGSSAGSPGVGSAASGGSSGDGAGATGESSAVDAGGSASAGGGPAQAAAPPPAQDPAPAPAVPAPTGTRARDVTDVSELRRLWPEVLEAVKARRRFAWMVLDGKAQVAAVEGSVLKLAFAREGDAKGFSQNGCDTVLREALTETLGVDWRIEATTGGAPAAPTTAAAVQSAGSGHAPPRRDVPPPPDEPEPEPDYADVDEVADSVAAPPEDGLTGLPLLERELGARVIDEPPEPGAS